MTLVLAGDTQELHRKLEMPTVEGTSLLIHIGDATMFSRSMAAIADFNLWLDSLPYTHKIYMPGNHESFIEADPSKRSLLSSATVLINESIEIASLKIRYSSASY
jgi:hypothetical protein